MIFVLCDAPPMYRRGNEQLVVAVAAGQSHDVDVIQRKHACASGSRHLACGIDGQWLQDFSQPNLVNVNH